MSYKNVVTMCGTNNLKSADADPLAVYKVYKGKIEDIRKLNPRCNIFICPVLPSRSHIINKKILDFNRFLRSDLTKSELNVHIVDGFSQFVDREGLLKSVFHDKRSQADDLHINDKGYCILVRCIKDAIFRNKLGSKVHSSRLYSRALSDGLPGPDHR